MRILRENIFSKNPVFVLFLGLVPAVAVTSTAYGGLVLGVVTGIILILTTVLTSLMALFLPENVRPVANLGVLIILTVLAHNLLLSVNPQIVGLLDIFLPLLVVNSLVVYSLNQGELSFGAAFLDSLGKSLGFVLALVVIGIIREFLGFGTFFAIRIYNGNLPPLSLARTVPGGMIILGLLAALVNKFRGQGGELRD